MTRSHTRSLGALLAVLAAAACGGARPAAAQATLPHPTGGHGHSHGGTITSTDTARWTQADVRFMTAMIGHHAQAVQMSRLAPDRAEANAVRILAQRIISAQQDEIATMQTWLRDRGQPVPEAHAAMDHGSMNHGAAGQAGADHGAHGLMPGMLTPEQMARLEQSTGAEFDRLFLSFMIQHHGGATAMVRELFGSWGAGQDETVFKFASDVNVDQETEIARMQRMLADLTFGAAAP
jgi:uncharacterized protein (DUF305 family)